MAVPTRTRQLRWHQHEKDEKETKARVHKRSSDSATAEEATSKRAIEAGKQKDS